MAETNKDKRIDAKRRDEKREREEREFKTKPTVSSVEAEDAGGLDNTRKLREIAGIEANFTRILSKLEEAREAGDDVSAENYISEAENMISDMSDAECRARMQDALADLED